MTYTILFCSGTKLIRLSNSKDIRIKNSTQLNMTNPKCHLNTRCKNINLYVNVDSIFQRRSKDVFLLFHIICNASKTMAKRYFPRITWILTNNFFGCFLYQSIANTIPVSEQKNSVKEVRELESLFLFYSSKLF